MALNSLLTRPNVIILEDDSDTGGMGDGSSESNVSESEVYDDEEVDRQDSTIRQSVRRQLVTSIEGTGKTGRFVTTGAETALPNPGIFIKGSVGGIGIPLYERDAKALTEASHSAPGKPFEWNLDQFEIRNHAWHRAVRDILKKVVVELGVMRGVTIKAELRKMQVYVAGQVIKSDRNARKKSGILGTLIIALPSEHKGGELRVTHEGRSKVVDTAKSSSFGFTYAAWYADVHDETKPIEGGYRFTLEYHLIHTGPGAPRLAASLNNKKAKLEQALEVWNTSYRERKKGHPKALAYILGHKYDDEALQFACLRGGDKERGALIKEFEVDEDDYEEYLILKRIVSLDGRQVISELNWREKDIAQHNPFLDREPDEETGDEYEGEEKIWRNTVAILMPKDHDVILRFEAAKSGDVNLVAWIQHLVGGSSNPVNADSKSQLSRLCRHIIGAANRLPADRSSWSSVDRNRLSHELMGEVVITALHLEDLDIARDALDAAPRQLSMRCFQVLGHAVNRFGFPSTREILEKSLTLTRSISEHQTALENIYTGNLSRSKTGPLADTTPIETWIKEQTEKSLDTDSVTREDGQGLITMGLRYGNEFFIEHILPCAKKHLSDTSFAIPFANHLFEAGLRGSLDRDIATTAFRTTVADLIPAFTLATLERPAKRQRIHQYGWEPRAGQEEDPEDSHLDSSDIGKLIGQCIALSLNVEIDQILEKLNAFTIAADSNVFKCILIPFLKHLIIALRDHGIPFKTDKYSRFVQQVILAYQLRYVGKEPPEPRNWVRQPSGCGCKDCKLELDPFLISASRKSAQFSMAESRRKHLESQVSHEEYILETVKQGVPHTLVITKTKNAWQKLKRGWLGRLADAKRDIQGIAKKAELQEVLGAQFEELWEFRGCQLPE